MTLSLSTSDLVKIAADKFGINTTDIEVTDYQKCLSLNPDSSIPAVLPLDIYVLFRSVEKFHYNNNEKISAIKSLRQYVTSTGRNLRLSDARWAVENWNEWRNFVYKYGVLPREGYFHHHILSK